MRIADAFNNSEVTLGRCEVPLAGLPAAFDGLRIVQISDLHAPKPLEFVRRVNGVVREARPDLLAITGDMVDHAHWVSAARRQLAALLEGVRPSLGTYGVLGNHDRDVTGQLLTSLGVVMLHNRCIPVRRQGGTLNIAGLYARKRRAVPVAVRRLIPLLPAAGPTILLAHLPSTIRWLPEGRVDLQLSGHTHAGQWRFWRLGCVWPHDDIPRRLAWGLHQVGGTYLHVTAGLGESGPIPVRFRCPPEVSVVMLRRARPRNGMSCTTDPW